jgi:hypothetical protein
MSEQVGPFERYLTSWRNSYWKLWDPTAERLPPVSQLPRKVVPPSVKLVYDYLTIIIINMHKLESIVHSVQTKVTTQLGPAELPKPPSDPA